MSTITVVGAGGNIGSHLVPHLARLPGVSRLILVDPDVYEEKNLRSQEIGRRDVGRPKVIVQAKRAKAVNADIEVVTHAVRMEEVPLGRLRADVIVAGLDSRVSRQSVNQAAWRLGVPWIDAGVSAGGMSNGGDLLARVNVYAPAFDAPCLECAWSDADYAALEVKHACESKLAVAATNAPSYLGALAASLAAVECARVLAGDAVGSLASRQVVLDARHHTHFVTSFRRNPRCRFDHQTWKIERTPRTVKELRLADVFQLLRHPGCSEPQPGCDDVGSDAVSLSLEGHRFWMHATCPRGCAASKAKSLPVVVDRLKEKSLPCPTCGGAIEPRGMDLAEALLWDDLKTSQRKRTLGQLGVRDGDVFTTTVRENGQERTTYLEAGAA